MTRNNTWGYEPPRRLDPLRGFGKIEYFPLDLISFFHSLFFFFLIKLNVHKHRVTFPLIERGNKKDRGNEEALVPRQIDACKHAIINELSR